MRYVVSFLVVAASGVIVSAVTAQETQSPPPSELKRQILELKYPILDLRLGTQDTSGGTRAVSGKIQDLAIKESATEVRIELAADVLFDFDKAEIKPQAAAALKKAAAVLREKAKGPVRIEGHTDSKGSDDYNQRLSQRRAAAVQTWLVKREGLTRLQFGTAGLGASRPVTPNTNPDGSDNPDGRQRNRRVEIIAGKVG
jgi:outer membrane protein OmpA-like peptidoglycan-associated protein